MNVMSDIRFVKITFRMFFQFITLPAVMIMYSCALLTLFGMGGTFLSPCPCWIRFCQLIFFFSKFSNFLEVIIDISQVILAPSSLSLKKVAAWWL